MDANSKHPLWRRRFHLHPIQMVQSGWADDPELSRLVPRRLSFSSAHAQSALGAGGQRSRSSESRFQLAALHLELFEHAAFAARDSLSRDSGRLSQSTGHPPWPGTTVLFA